MRRVFSIIIAAGLSGQMLFAGQVNKISSVTTPTYSNEFLAVEQEASPVLEDWMLNRLTAASAPAASAEGPIALEDWMVSNMLDSQEVVRETAIQIEAWMISNPIDAQMVVHETALETEAWMLQPFTGVQEPEIALENWMFVFHR